MTALAKNMYAIVQHSGFGYGYKPAFMHAVETRLITTVGERNRVVKAGGLVFDQYGVADDFCEAIHYKPQESGMIPMALGTFSPKDIDGLQIYIPTIEERRLAIKMAGEKDAMVY